MTRLKAGALVAAAALAATAGLAYAMPHNTQSVAVRADTSGGGVSKAEFDRLEGQVQDLQRRVASLEHGGGHTGGKPGKGKAATDDWETQ